MVLNPPNHAWSAPKLLSLPQGFQTLKVLDSRFRGNDELGDFKCDCPALLHCGLLISLRLGGAQGCAQTILIRLTLSTNRRLRPESLSSCIGASVSPFHVESRIRSMSERSPLVLMLSKSGTDFRKFKFEFANQKLDCSALVGV